MKTIACYVDPYHPSLSLSEQIDEMTRWAEQRNYPVSQMRYHPFFIKKDRTLDKDEYEGMIQYAKEGTIERLISINLPTLEKNANWTVLLLTCKNSDIPVEVVGVGEVEVNHSLLNSLKALL
jgi:hypothetical protein